MKEKDRKIAGNKANCTASPQQVVNEHLDRSITESALNTACNGPHCLCAGYKAYVACLVASPILKDLGSELEIIVLLRESANVSVICGHRQIF